MEYHNKSYIAVYKNNKRSSRLVDIIERGSVEQDPSRIRLLKGAREILKLRKKYPYEKNYSYVSFSGCSPDQYIPKEDLKELKEYRKKKKLPDIF